MAITYTVSTLPLPAVRVKGGGELGLRPLLQQPLGDAVLILGLEASNLLNAGTVLERELDLGTGRAALADETLASRVFRMQVRMSWR